MTRLLTTVLALVLATSAARADVGVVVTGEATLQPQLAAELENWLKQRGHALFVSALDPDAINTLIDCVVIDDLNCARTLIQKRAKSQAIVYVRVEMSPETDGSRAVSMVGYWFQKGHETIAERRICHQCNDDAIRTSADDLMHALAGDPPLSSHVPSPKEAAASGAPAEPPPVTTEEQPSHLIPAIAIGAGAALAITGGVLVAIDQDANPNGIQQPNLRDTKTGGYVCLGLGAAAVGAGLYLWFHNSSSAPVAQVSHDGATIGWSGRF